MGRVRLYFSFWFYPLAVLLAGVWIETGRAASATTLPALMAIGLLTWTLVEYLLHRFVFHPRKGARIAKLAGILHGEHHRHPRQVAEILVRPAASLIGSAAVAGLALAATGDPVRVAGVMVGVWVGFLYYEWVHLRVHTSSAGGVMGWQRRRHFHHHFVDPTRAYGVTSPIWDVVFGTREQRTGSKRADADA